MAAVSPDEMADLVRQAQAGSEEAATMLYEHWREPLLAVIRVKLKQPLRRLFDSDDFLNDAFSEMFRRRFSEELLRSPAALGKYLRTIAVNKVLDAERKYLGTERFNIGAEVPLEDGGAGSYTTDDASPLDDLIRAESVQRMLQAYFKQLPPVYREVLRLMMEGREPKEVAAAIRIKQSTVYRILRLVTDRARMDGWMDGWVTAASRGGGPD